MNAAFALFALAAAEQPSFEEWAAMHGINGADDAMKANYAVNAKLVEQLNAESETATFIVNKFSGMAWEEFAAKYLNLKAKQGTDLPMFKVTIGSEVDAGSLLSAVDWDTTPVKDQKQCGSCWAFGTIGAIEGMHKVKTGETVILSEQQLVDCVHTSDGCGGGRADNAFDYLKGQPLYTSASYPYTARDGNCHSGSASGILVSGYTAVDPSDGAMAQALMKAPVTVAITPDNAFANYHTGILTNVPTSCGVAHQVVLTGFGSNYWKVKNSWGADWGDHGYAKFERATSGCGPYGLFETDPAMAGLNIQPILNDGPVPPTPPSPTPPAPTPTPAPGSSHYGRPPCLADETKFTSPDHGTEVCARQGCSSSCPMDVPEGASTEPQCNTQVDACFLTCSSDSMCPPGGRCIWQECWYPELFLPSYV